MRCCSLPTSPLHALHDAPCAMQKQQHGALHASHTEWAPGSTCLEQFTPHSKTGCSATNHTSKMTVAHSAAAHSICTNAREWYVAEEPTAPQKELCKCKPQAVHPRGACGNAHQQDQHAARHCVHVMPVITKLAGGHSTPTCCCCQHCQSDNSCLKPCLP